MCTIKIGPVHVVYRLGYISTDTLDMNMQHLNEALSDAICIGSIRGIQLAIDDGVDINKPIGSQDDRSPLHLAVNFGRPNIIQHLLRSGAVVDNNCKMWTTAINNQYSTDVFEYLLSSLREAISSGGHLEGPKLNAAVWEYLQPSSSFSFIDHVAIHGSPAMLSRMLFNGIPVNKSNEPGGVMYALLKNWNQYKTDHEYRYFSYNIEKARLLIQAGASVDSRPGELSALQIAVGLKQGLDCDLVRLILETGNYGHIDSEYVAHGDPHGSLRRSMFTQPRSVLVHNICRNIDEYHSDNRASIMSALIEHGANCTHMWMGISPLFLALERELDSRDSMRVSVLDVLLAHMTKHDVKMPATSSGRSLVLQTLLPGYSSKSKSDTLEKLLAAGADQNAIDGPTGETPLYSFMSRILQQGMGVYSPPAYSDLISRLMFILLQNPDLDVFRKNRDGSTVIDLVNENIHEWHMGRPLYELFHRIVMKRYEDARRCFAMALHEKIGPASKVSDFPPEMMHAVLDMKHYYLLPDVCDVFADNTDTDEDE